MPATQSLSEAAEGKLTDAIDSSTDSEPTILWWDSGGHLEGIVRTAAEALGCAFRAVDTTPLELRAEAPRERTVWYVPKEKDDYSEWFEDIEATGNSITTDIGGLAVACFEERVQAWSLQSAYDDADSEKRTRIARLLTEELESKKGNPPLEALQTQIVLDGDENPIKYVLERSGDRIPEPKLDDIRELLLDRGVGAVEGVTDPETLVSETRKWAIAEWMIDAGVDEAAFPPSYRPPDKADHLTTRPALKSLLSLPSTPTETVASRFLDPGTTYWDDVVTDLENPLDQSGCVVGGALEARLWNLWETAYTDGEFDRAARIATTRQAELSRWYDETPWTNCWAQAEEVTTLAEALQQWQASDRRGDVVSVYGDLEEGTWQIDCAVYKLIISGTPEAKLPDEHPASDSLGTYRSGLLENDYIEYLEDLSALVEEAFESGEVFTNQDHAHQFFTVEQEYLQSGEEAIIFVIDGLRFDLAHVLAEELRNSEDERFVVHEQPWVGTLPSETSFGKAALTPGNKFDFGIGLDGEDSVVPIRSGQTITRHRRKKILENDGWTYITKSNGETGWNDPRVIYYYNDLDEIAHENFDDFEELFADRINQLAEMIRDKIGDDKWETAFVVTDHGFVSLPPGTKLKSDDSPTNATVSRRFAGGKNLGDTSPGIRLDSASPIRYLQGETELEILTDPTKQFGKRGHDEVRYMHGGGLPQEFVLNFLRIEQE